MMHWRETESGVWEARGKRDRYVICPPDKTTGGHWRWGVNNTGIESTRGRCASMVEAKIEVLREEAEAVDARCGHGFGPVLPVKGRDE